MKRPSQILTVMIAMLPLQSFTTYSTSKDTIVYICVTGKVYHSKRSCKGLDNAKHKIIAVSKDEAISKYGRRACKICY